MHYLPSCQIIEILRGIDNLPSLSSRFASKPNTIKTPNWSFAFFWNFPLLWLRIGLIWLLVFAFYYSLGNCTSLTLHNSLSIASWLAALASCLIISLVLSIPFLGQSKIILCKYFRYPIFHFCACCFSVIIQSSFCQRGVF